MKLKVFSLFVLASLPAFSSALFFGLNITPPEDLLNLIGLTGPFNNLLTLTPNQTFMAFALSAIAAGLAAFALRSTLLALEPRPHTATLINGNSNTAATENYGYGTYGGYDEGTYRSKRQVDAYSDAEAHGFVNEMYLAIPDNDLESCFERLVCDIASDPTAFTTNASVIHGVKEAAGLQHAISQKAFVVAKQLLRAVEFGESAKHVGLCETVYNRCQWTGKEMDGLLSEYQKLAQDVL